MPRPETQRLFFALNPPPPVRRQIDDVCRRMAQGNARVVVAENLHITLVFLGQVEISGVEPLLEMMSAVAFHGCELCLDRCGHFRRARVGWIGSSQVPAPLAVFQHGLAEAARTIGFKLDDRRWTPHVTVYRKMRTMPGNVTFRPIRWNLDSYDLMVSESRRGGVQYRSIGRHVANS